MLFGIMKVSEEVGHGTMHLLNVVVPASALVRDGLLVAPLASHSETEAFHGLVAFTSAEIVTRVIWKLKKGWGARTKPKRLRSVIVARVFCRPAAVSAASVVVLRSANDEPVSAFDAEEGMYARTFTAPGNPPPAAIDDHPADLGIGGVPLPEARA